MSDSNEKMVALLTASAPARDLGFEIAVLAKIEQRRFRRSMARNIAAAAAMALLLAMIVPQLAWMSLLPGGWSSALAHLVASDSQHLVMLALMLAAFAAWRWRPGADI